MFKKNVALGKSLKVSNWRKSAVGSYSQTGDCQIYSIQTINIGPALSYIAANDK